MSLILNIDTAFEKAYVAISRNGEVIAQQHSETQKDHASFLQPAIQQICNSLNIALTQIDAVAVSNGPGSYTGLRVGLSSAKGICYALNKPLITINTLFVIAFAIKQQYNSGNDILFCPMIDARRMEVFTALYNYQLEQVKQPEAAVVDETFLQSERKNHTIIAGGNGSSKVLNFPGFKDFILADSGTLIQHLCAISYHQYKQKAFADIIYTEPFYIKPVYIRSK